MKSDIIKDFALPTYIKGKSFADASKAIDSKFKDRVDNASIATKKELLERLASAQEHIKMKEEIATAASTNQMFNGGVVGQGLAKDATIEQQGEAIAGITGAAGAALDFGNQMFGDTGIDSSGLAGRQEQTNVGMGAASGAIKGASAGAAFGPVGALAGGVIGGAAGLIGGSRANKKVHEGNMNASRIENNKFSNDFRDGGPLFNYTPTITNPGVMPMSGITNKTGGVQDIKNYMVSEQADMAKQSLLNSRKKGPSTLGKVANWMGENYGEILNTAPIATNALQLATMKKADPVSYDRLDARYKPHVTDERALENKVQNETNNTVRSLAGATNGSMGALRSSLLGAGLNKTNALSDAYLKADQMNAQENRIGQQFNAQQDAMNLRTSMMETNERRADDAAFESAKSEAIDRLGTNIGDFGRTQMYKKMAIKATDYGWDGKYYTNKKTGHTMSAAEYKAQFGTKKEKE